MNSLDFFNDFIKNQIPKSYLLAWSKFTEGDFGDLTRVTFDSEVLCGCVDFWSNGTVNMDLFNILKNEQVFNILCFKEEEQQIKESFKKMLMLM
jgi:hypothetical protein